MAVIDNESTWYIYGGTTIKTKGRRRLFESSKRRDEYKQNICQFLITLFNEFSSVRRTVAKIIIFDISFFFFVGKF